MSSFVKQREVDRVISGQRVNAKDADNAQDDDQKKDQQLVEAVGR